MAIEANKRNISGNKEEIEALKREIAARTQNPTVHEQKIVETIRVVEENSSRFSALADYDVKSESSR